MGKVERIKKGEAVQMKAQSVKEFIDNGTKVPMLIVENVRQPINFIDLYLPDVIEISSAVSAVGIYITHQLPFPLL